MRLSAQVAQAFYMIHNDAIWKDYFGPSLLLYSESKEQIIHSKLIFFHHVFFATEPIEAMHMVFKGQIDRIPDANARDVKIFIEDLFEVRGLAA